GLERLPAIEAPLAPLTIHLLPVTRLCAAIVDVRPVLSIRHLPRRDCKGSNFDIVRPFLVVEDEALLATLGAVAERPARKFEIGVRTITSCGPDPEFRIGVAE